MIAAALNAYGIPFRDARVPGRPGVYRPSGILIHHTASARSVRPGGSVPLLQEGRSDLPGPLCQIHIDRAAQVWLITDGRGNHAGRETGDMGDHDGRPGEDGNAELLGIEVDNDGLGEPWPQPVLDRMVDVCAALCAYTGWPVGRVLGHKEWTTRKIDPSGVDMDKFRWFVAARLDRGPDGPKPIEPPVPPPAPSGEPEMCIRFLQAALSDVPADGIWGPATAASCARQMVGWRRYTRQDTIERGPLVRWVQQTLINVFAASIAADSVMGPETNHWIVQFQKSRGLAADGIVGPRTYRAIVDAHVGRR